MFGKSVATGRRHSYSSVIQAVTISAAFCIFSAPSQSQTADLVTSAIDPASRVVLRGQRALWALPKTDRGAVPGDAKLEHLTLVLKRSPQQQKAFEQFLQQLQDPASPNYHRWLTPIQVGKRFGASEHDIAAISGWLRGQDLRVNSVSNSRIMIDFSGHASLISAAFAIELRYYRVSGEQRMAAAGDPQIPAALAAVIQSVRGLNTLHDHPYLEAEPVQVPAGGAAHDLPAFSNCSSGTCVHFITPEDFSIIYDKASVTLGGSGQNIAVIGRSRVYDPDITNFASLTGVATQPPVVVIPTNGTDPGPPAGTGGSASPDQLEATLDVMRAGSVAPLAVVDLVVSADTNGSDGLGIAAQYAVDHSPVIAQVMNVSYGACEALRTLADVQFWDTLFSAAAAEGITVFVASGDSGVAGCDPYFQTPPSTQVASPNYICSSSYSTCVGGTEFADTANPSLYWSQVNDGIFGSALRYIPEGGWNEPLKSSGATAAAASGGGFSSYIATPSWQVGTGVPGTQGRYTPDLAFSSSGHDGYFGCLAASGGTHPGDCVVNNGSFFFEYFFGTSAASPSMAGIAALLNEKLGGAQGEINQRLYLLAANPANKVFNDATVATSGVSSCVVTTPSMCNNSTPSPTALTGGLAGYLLTPGFDEVTGLGSIDVANLLANYNPGSATATVVASSQNPAKLGATVTFTATVTTAGTNSPTGMVNFLDGSSILGSSALATVNGSQVATITSSTLAAGTHSITAAYAGDANNAASTSSTLTQTVTPPTFTWAANGSTSGTVLSGQSATYNFTATPTSAATFAANVVFSCSGLPDATVTCSFNPSQITASSGTTPVQLTITTTGPNNGPGAKLRRRAGNRVPWIPLTLPLLGIVAVCFAQRKRLTPIVIARNCLPLALLALLIACGGGGNSTPPPIGVIAGPGTPASVFPNNAADSWPAQTAQFTASVTNTTNTAVTWSVTTANGGTIDNTGLFTAPTVAAGLPTSVTVTATSVADPSKSGSATEVLTAATLPGTYTVTVTAAESTTANSAPVTLAAQ